MPCRSRRASSSPGGRAIGDVVRRDERQGECLLLERAARRAGGGLLEAGVIEGGPLLVERPLEGFRSRRTYPSAGVLLGGVEVVRVLRQRRRSEQDQGDGERDAAQLSRPQP